MKIYRAIAYTILLLSLFQSSYADPTLPVPVGRVIWVKGTFRATMPNNEVRLLQKMSPIYLTDVLQTDANSNAQIAFTDNTLMTFRPETKFIIDQYNFQPKNKTGKVGKFFMRLIEGGFRTVTGVIAKINPNNYQINTDVATIGVRGTDYAVYMHAGQLLIATYTGSPCFGNKNGNLCLSTSNRFGSITQNTAPVVVKEQPSIFNEKLEITPVKISPFATSNPVGPTKTSTTGFVNSFCIQ